MDYVIHSDDCAVDMNGRPVRMYDMESDTKLKIWNGEKLEEKRFVGGLVVIRLFKSIPPCDDKDALWITVAGGKFDGFKGLFIPCTK